MNAILNYPGAKWGMAQEIVQIMPPHRSYLEPFAGSLAVLFNKPRSAIETVHYIDVYARERSYCRNCWNDMPENIRAAAERLKEVQIENRPALELIRRFRHVNVLIYADPPYLLETRSGKQYRHEMTDADHEALLAALKAHPGPVILSGYHSPMYDSELSGWNIIERKAYNQNGDRRTEVLWCNYEIPALI